MSKDYRGQEFLLSLKETKGGSHRETRGITPTKLSNENKR
jgi:hypothetical protein